MAASFSHHRGGGAAGQAPVVDPGDPPRDRGHSRGAGHRHRNPRAALVNFLGIYWLFSALRRDQDAVTAGLTLPYSNR